MALLRSLLTGVSGLRSQQTAIDVTGDNIANVSTIGFKQGRVDFSTLISQNLRFGSAPSGFLGGTNPAQIGLGVQTAQIQKLWTQGSLKATGIATDLAIDDGSQARTFFVLSDVAGQNIYTRNGTFSLNRTGQLYDAASGSIVQGWMADSNTQVVKADGSIDFALTTGGTLENISIEIGNLTIAKETTYADFRGNLNGAGDIAAEASILESDSLFDSSSGSLVAATESTLLTNLVRSSTGDATGNAVDMDISIGSVITLEANVGGSGVRREFIVGDPPPSGGTTLGDLRNWMQGALGIDRSAVAGDEKISATRTDATTGEAVNGTVDQVGAAGYTTISLAGWEYKSVTDAGISPAATPTSTSITVDILDPQDATGATSLIGGATAVAITGTGAGGIVTASDLQSALNSLATSNDLVSQFSVSGTAQTGFTVTNLEGNGFSSTVGTNAIFGAALTFGGGGNVIADATLGIAQAPKMNAGDTITFDNFTPLMATQTLTAVASGAGNSASQFELGATASETATNIATAINMNSALSGLATASVVGNQIQLQAKTPGVDGNFTISVSNSNSTIVSTIGLDTSDAAVGDSFDVSTDGNVVASSTTVTLTAAALAAINTSDVDPGADGTLEFQVSIGNYANSPVVVSVADLSNHATLDAFATALVAAINADANLAAAGFDNFAYAAGSADATAGTFEITNSDNAQFSLAADTSTGGDSDDFSYLATSSVSSRSNGLKIVIVPQGGAASVGETAVEIGTTSSGTARNIAAAVNGSSYTNPPLSVSAIGSFVRISDSSSIESGQGNATAGANILQSVSSGFSTDVGTQLIGAGASVDSFIRPDAASFTTGVATATLVDDEMDFVAAGVQVGDLIRFSTGNAAGLIARITQVGYKDSTTAANTLVADPHAIQFEVQSSDNFPVASSPSAYTIHEAASVDIGVSSNLALANPPAGMDTASGAGKLRVSGHVGTANRISNLEIKVRNDNGTQNIVTSFDTLNEADGESFRTSYTVFDSLGTPRVVDMVMWLESKSNGGTTWRWQASAQDNNVSPGTVVDTVVGSGTVQFDTQGRYLGDSGDQVMIQLDDFGVDDPVTYSLNFGSITGFASEEAADGSSSKPTEVFLYNQDGFKAGTLQDFTIGTDGRVTGMFDNGLIRTLGQIATARFSNPQGLEGVGDNYFREGVNSGQALIGTAGNAGRGLVRSGFLEESNVELAQQFTDLISAQRAFQANSRTITVSSQLLQELVNLI